jgi:hypothetical protein
MDKATMVITLDPVADHVGVLFDDLGDEREDHPGQHEGAMFKEEFFRYYLDGDMGDCIGAVYEPLTDTYRTEHSDGEVREWKKPKDHPVLEAIDAWAEDIMDDEMIIKHTIYPGLSHRTETGWLEALLQISEKKKVKFKKIDDIDFSDPEVLEIANQFGINEGMKGRI